MNVKRLQTVLIGLALITCSFAVGWVVAQQSSPDPSATTNNPFGSARVLELPGEVKPLQPEVVPPTNIPRLQGHSRKLVVCKNAKPADCLTFEIPKAK